MVILLAHKISRSIPAVSNSFGVSCRDNLPGPKGRRANVGRYKLRLIRLVLPIVSLLLLHTAAVLERPDWGLVVLFGASVAGFVGAIATRGPIVLARIYGLILAVLAVLVGLSLFQSARWAQAVFVPAVAINLAISALFAFSMFPGRAALVTQMARLHHDGDLPEPLVRYTRMLTLIWALLLAAMAIEAGLLAYYTNIATWSWAVNFVNPLILVLFFVGQFWYRRVRYRQYGEVSMVRAMQKIMRHDGD